MAIDTPDHRPFSSIFGDDYNQNPPTDEAGQSYIYDTEGRSTSDNGASMNDKSPFTDIQPKQAANTKTEPHDTNNNEGEYGDRGANILEGTMLDAGKKTISKPVIKNEPPAKPAPKAKAAPKKAITKKAPVKKLAKKTAKPVRKAVKKAAPKKTAKLKPRKIIRKTMKKAVKKPVRRQAVVKKSKTAKARTSKSAPARKSVTKKLPMKKAASKAPARKKAPTGLKKAKIAFTKQGGNTRGKAKAGGLKPTSGKVIRGATRKKRGRK
ncbi:MAG: hypothetical protein JWM56_542 [Candidatus Peribacteria bacterium]|nr:hypothetical protein [Candidatus Peribacteria bacterium]